MVVRMLQETRPEGHLEEMKNDSRSSESNAALISVQAE